MTIARRVLILGLLCGSLSLGADPFIENRISKEPEIPVTLHYEAESFNGLPVYADFHEQPGQGWYTKEHTHASGRALVVCDAKSEGAVLRKELGQSYPAGDYLIGVLAVLTRWRANELSHYGSPSGNLLRVEFGTTTEEGFRPVAMQRLKLLYGSAYGFCPLIEMEEITHKPSSVPGVDVERRKVTYRDPVLTIDQPWDTIRLVAERIVSGGMGDVPEFPIPYIVLDRLVITNEPGYLWQASHSARFKLFTRVELDEQAASKAAAAEAKAETANTEAAETPSLSATPLVNLVHDGSFEVGGKPYWFPGMQGNADYTFSVQDIEQGDAVHGERFARIRPAVSQSYDDEVPESEYVYSASVRSAPLDVEAGTYVLSLYARAKGIAKMEVLQIPAFARSGRHVVISFEPTANWSEQTAEFTIKTDQSIQLMVIVTTKDKSATIDLDALQVRRQEDGQPAGYVEGDGVAALVANPARYGTFHDDEPVLFDAVLINGSAASAERRLVCVVKDVAGLVYEIKNCVIQGEPGITRQSISFDFAGYGNFVLSCREATDQQRVWLVPFMRVQAPERVERETQHPVYVGMLGRNIRDRAGAMMRHFGFEFQNTLSNSTLRPESNTNGLYQHKTYVRNAQLAKSVGIRWIPWIYPKNLAPYDYGTISDGPASHGGKPWMSAEFGAWYSRFLLEAYRDVMEPVYMASDEFMNQIVPQSVVPYMSAVYQASKATAPHVQVMHSIEFQAAQYLERELGGVKGVWADMLGGSRYQMGELWYEREDRFVRRHDLPFFVDGVGWSGNGSDLGFFTESGQPTMPAKWYGNLNDQAWDLASMVATYRPVKWSVYTTKYASGASDPFNQISPIDGHLTSYAAQWLVLIQFMREARAGGLLHLDNQSNLKACAFTIGEMNWVALYAPSPSLLKEITLDVPVGGLQIKDLHLVEREAATTFRLRRNELLFVGSPARDFVDKVRQLQVKELLEVRYVLKANPEGMDCIATITNHDTIAYKGTLTLFEDMLNGKGPVSTPITLLPGKTQQVSQPQKPELFAGRPITYYPVKAELALDGFLNSGIEEVQEFLKSTAEGNYMLSGEYFWLHYATPYTAKDLDARQVATWNIEQSPASVLLNWGLNGSYQRFQVRGSAIHTDANMQGDSRMDHDYFSTHFVRYDDSALYLGAVVEEAVSFPGKPVDDWGEKIIYYLQPSLTSRNTHDIARIEVIQLTADTVKATLVSATHPDGLPLQASASLQSSKRITLVKAPFTELGFDIARHDTINFGITCYDSDSGDGSTEAIYDWSGASFKEGDPHGFGQLICR